MHLLPLITLDTALFLDFDGTLAELAPQPHAVRVATGLVRTLEVLHQGLNGALAIVTGRTIVDIDRFLSPLQLPIAAEHGSQYRMVDGRTPGITPSDLQVALDAADSLVTLHPGLLVERKTAAVALHYRQHPELETLCREVMQAAAAQMRGVELLQGKCVIEIKPACVNKGQAIASFMNEAPFAGRVPIFVGDDLTDEPGFSAAQQLGGKGIKVGEGATVALHRCMTPAALRGWLAAGRSHLSHSTARTTA